MPTFELRHARLTLQNGRIWVFLHEQQVLDAPVPVPESDFNGHYADWKVLKHQQAQAAGDDFDVYEGEGFRIDFDDNELIVE